MPIKQIPTKQTTHQVMKNCSYESQVIFWLMIDGWQVFVPMLDHGHQTDILISDGKNYHRLQIKTVNGKPKGKKLLVKNLWKDKQADVVIYFARDGNWGVVSHAFSTAQRSLDHKDNQHFHQNKKSFLAAFHKLR